MRPLFFINVTMNLCNVLPESIRKATEIEKEPLGFFEHTEDVVGI